MGNLKDVLKKLNKGKKEEDYSRLITEQEENFYKKTTTSTGSPFLDMITNGGFTQGGYNSIIADGGTGKTSLALMAIREEQKKTGRFAVYYDGEGTLDDSYIERMGADKSKMLIERGRNLEDMLDNLEAYSTADDVGIIIIDSIPIFIATSVQEKSAGDNSMAAEARRYTQRMPIIEANCLARRITLIGLTSFKKDPGAMGDPRYLSRGNWQLTMGNLMISLTKKDIIKDQNKNEIGHVLDVRVLKSKIAAYDKKRVYNTNFYYDRGFDAYDEYTDVMVSNGIVMRGGAWYSFPNIDGEEVKFQGKDKVIEYMKENPKDFEYLKTLLNE
ncbi:MAG: RecA/RadA recombinase [Flavobacteriaceae bacterium]|jgi:RecA/RadA recombinase